MNWLKEHEADSWILKGAIVFFLLFPAFYSPYTDVYQSAYYAGFSWAYFMMALYMAIQVWKKKEKIWPLSGAALAYFAGLLVYNLLSLYFNHKYLHWYWEQVNNTVAFYYVRNAIYTVSVGYCHTLVNQMAVDIRIF